MRHQTIIRFNLFLISAMLAIAVASAGCYDYSCSNYPSNVYTPVGYNFEKTKEKSDSGSLYMCNNHNCDIVFLSAKYYRLYAETDINLTIETYFYDMPGKGSWCYAGTWSSPDLYVLYSGNNSLPNLAMIGYNGSYPTVKGFKQTTISFCDNHMSNQHYKGMIWSSASTLLKPGYYWIVAREGYNWNMQVHTSCKPKYLNETKCSGNVYQTKMINSSCSYQWVDAANCSKYNYYDFNETYCSGHSLMEHSKYHEFGCSANGCKEIRTTALETTITNCTYGCDAGECKFSNATLGFMPIAGVDNEKESGSKNAFVIGGIAAAVLGGTAAVGFAIASIKPKSYFVDVQKSLGNAEKALTSIIKPELPPLPSFENQPFTSRMKEFQQMAAEEYEKALRAMEASLAAEAAWRHTMAVQNSDDASMRAQLDDEIVAAEAQLASKQAEALAIQRAIEKEDRSKYENFEDKKLVFRTAEFKTAPMAGQLVYSYYAYPVQKEILQSEGSMTMSNEQIEEYSRKNFSVNGEILRFDEMNDGHPVLNARNPNSIIVEPSCYLNEHAWYTCNDKFGRVHYEPYKGHLPVPALMGNLGDAEALLVYHETNNEALACATGSAIGLAGLKYSGRDVYKMRGGWYTNRGKIKTVTVEIPTSREPDG